MNSYSKYILLFLVFTGCVEPFEISTEILDQESALIVEATLTNELKIQKIQLSRPANFAVVNELDSIYDPVYPLLPRDPNIVFEQDALVTVSDDLGNNYRFNETSPGTYTSEVAFEAQQGVAYELQVVTADGTSYYSARESYNGDAEIDQLYASREFNEEGKEGVYIYLDGTGADEDSKYYRYTYEETYKIKSPNWQPQDFVLTNYNPCALPVITYDLKIINREDEEGKVCYGKQGSNEIIQHSTLGFQENRITRFPIRFLDRNNFIISHRYSVLVKQFVQSQRAYNFYRTLDSFSTSESVFSSVQPGLLEGNIKADGNLDKKVLGYFEVAPVTEKRLYFNYSDLFPDEPLPDYAIACNPWSPPLEHPSYCYTGMVIWPCPLSIVESVNINLISYHSLNSEGVGVCPGPYLVNYRACGDCTVLGASQVPDFWVE